LNRFSVLKIRIKTLSSALSDALMFIVSMAKDVLEKLILK